MIGCCGKGRPTPFCPMCGKDLTPQAPLRGLMKHIVTRLAVLRKDLARWQRSDKCEDLAEGSKRSIRKWESWRDALEAAMPDAEATP